MKLKTLAVSLTLAASNVFAANLPAEEKVDPQEQKILKALESLNPKPLHTLTPEEARKGPTAKDAVEKVLKDEGKPTTPEKVDSVVSKSITTAQGNLKVRVYTPEGPGPFPGIVYFHGGGFVIADLDVYDSGARALVNQGKAVLVSVAYRLAPEHPYPAAPDDAVSAFNYVHDHPSEFKVDSNRLAVAGESAGGNLATVVSIRQKATGKPMPIAQVLVYPFVTQDVSSPSHKKNGKGNYILGNADIAWFWKYYLGDGWSKNRDGYALPIYATTDQLRGLPPTLIITAGLDPLMDEGQTYAKNLRAARVKVDVKNYPGVTHEFFGMAAALDKAKQAQADAGVFLRKSFLGPSSEP